MYRRALLLTLTTVIIVLQVVRAQEDSRSARPAAKEMVIREGTQVDLQPVVFRADNNQLLVEFGLEKKSIQVLENLASQRIYRAYRDDADDKRWTISGIFTEFEDRNYLLIEQAVRSR